MIAFFIDQTLIFLVVILPMIRFFPGAAPLYVSGSPALSSSSALPLVYAYTTLLAFLLSISYWTLTEWLAGGQSVGKMIMGLRTVSTSAKCSLSFSQSFFRSVPKSMNMLLVIDCVPLMNPKGVGLRFSDKAFDTRVVDWNSGEE